MSVRRGASQRWSLLRDYVLNTVENPSKLDDCLYSANIFGLFEIIQVVDSPTVAVWRLVPLVAPGSCKFITLAIPKTPPEPLKLRDLAGFDRTGVAVPLWPCELLLAYFFMLPPGRIQNIVRLPFPCRRAIELAAGGLGVGAIALASVFQDLDYIALTDGNEKCVLSLEKVLRAGNYTFQSKLESAFLRWSDSTDENYAYCQHRDYSLASWTIDYKVLAPDLPSGHEEWKNSFDIVFATDCFFNKSHVGLLRCIDFLLSKRPGSTFLALAPLRSNTLKSFVELSSSPEVCELFQWTVEFLSPETVFPELSGDPEKMVPHMVYIQRR